MANGQSCRRVFHTTTSSPALGTLTTSPDTGIGRDDDVVSGVSPHGTGVSLAHRAASVVVGVPREEHEKVLIELDVIRETLGKIQSALDVMQARIQALELGQVRIQALESGQAWMEVQLDLLIRMQQPMSRPAYAAQAHLQSRGTISDTA